MLALALSLAGDAVAHRRELELTRIHEHPSFAGSVGLGTYNPDSSRSGASPNLSFGLRYITPYKDIDSLEYGAIEFSAATLFSGSEDIETYMVTSLNFFPRTRLFEFDHHFFFGAGLGTAVVARPGTNTLTLPMGSVVTGLTTRVRHFEVEGSVRLLIGPRRHVFDATGVLSQFALVYPFDF